MSVAFHASTEETRKEAELPATEVIERVNEILGYDVLETEAIQKDGAVHDRIVSRLSTSGDYVAAEDVLGPLDDEEE